MGVTRVPYCNKGIHFRTEDPFDEFFKPSSNAMKKIVRDGVP